MEKGHLEKHYGEELIDAILPYNSLKEEDRARLVELAHRLEEEFGDLRVNSQQVQQVFWEEL